VVPFSRMDVRGEFVEDMSPGLQHDLDQDRIYQSTCSLPRSVDCHSIVTFGPSLRLGAYDVRWVVRGFDIWNLKSFDG